MRSRLSRLGLKKVLDVDVPEDIQLLVLDDGIEKGLESVVAVHDIYAANTQLDSVQALVSSSLGETLFLPKEDARLL